MTEMGYNTGEMQTWSGDVDRASEEYETMSNSYFNTVDAMSAYYTGGLADTYREDVLAKKPSFSRMAEAIAECAEVIKHQAISIDDTEDELAYKARSGNILDNG